MPDDTEFVIDISDEWHGIDRGFRLVDINSDGYIDFVHGGDGSNEAWVNAKNGNWIYDGSNHGELPEKFVRDINTATYNQKAVDFGSR